MVMDDDEFGGCPNEKAVGEAQDAAADAQSAADSRGAEEGTAGGKSKGKGRGRGAGSGRKTTTRVAKPPCLVESCQALRSANARFCVDHKRNTEAMEYQATNSSEPDALDLWKAMKENDAACAKAVYEFSLDNPPDAKYRRKSLIDWAQYRRVYGSRVTKRDRCGDVPMWEGEFLHWAQETKRLPEAEAVSWWKETYKFRMLHF